MEANKEVFAGRIKSVEWGKIINPPKQTNKFRGP
jgi:hypothetical protein